VRERVDLGAAAVERQSVTRSQARLPPEARHHQDNNYHDISTNSNDNDTDRGGPGGSRRGPRKDSTRYEEDEGSSSGSPRGHTGAHAAPGRRRGDDDSFASPSSLDRSDSDSIGRREVGGAVRPLNIEFSKKAGYEVLFL
jgi:hypothetical protein